jgi:hypothetical protein
MAFAKYTGATSTTAVSLIPNDIKAGKLYEAHVLGCIARDLTTKEGLELVLVQGSKIVLKGSPGPINSAYPHIEVRRSGIYIADLWTDVEVSTLSFARSGLSTPALGHYHELDIVMVDATTSGRPRPDQLWLGVECKHTPYDKALLRQILGVRRELSLLQDAQQSRFSKWPVSTVPAEPPSCLIVYSSSNAVLNYTHPGEVFGIRFIYEPLV